MKPEDRMKRWRIAKNSNILQTSEKKLQYLLPDSPSFAKIDVERA
jgi:hypothetical protein